VNHTVSKLEEDHEAIKVIEKTDLV